MPGPALRRGAGPAGRPAPGAGRSEAVPGSVAVDAPECQCPGLGSTSCGDRCAAAPRPGADARRGPADHPARAGVPRRGRPPGRCPGHAAPARRGPAGHHQRARPVTRAGRLRPARPGAAAADRARLLASRPAGRLRVLVPRGLRAADRGVALVRVPPPGAARPGQALASEPRQRLRRGAGPAARRRPAHRHPARRGQEGRPLVGLVRDQDRRRMAAGRRRGHLRPPGRLAAGLRPARAGAARRAAGCRARRRGLPGPPGRRGRPRAGRGHPGRPGRLPPAA